jgi:hypothetical protein
MNSIAPSVIYHKNKGTYHVIMSFLYVYRTNELTKLIKILKNFTHVFSIILQLCIKFQVQIASNEEAVKKIKFLRDLNS